MTTTIRTDSPRIAPATPSHARVGTRTGTTGRGGALAVAVAAALALQGCAGTKSGGGSDVASVCNPVIVGLGAAAACAALASGHNRVRTGAACAAVAVTACYLANSYKAEQVRSAKQVEDEYLKANARLPERATVTAYRSQVNPNAAVSRGQEVKLVSTIVAVPGRTEKNVVVEEEVGIFDAQNEAWGKPVRKTANGGKEAGEFQTSFTIPIRDGWSQGVYTLRRTLYVNGAVAQKDETSTRFQVVQLDDARSLALAAR
jgi:hypothetical protein